jgi:uncharacterized membrane protein YdjX (TVP38/TMEM64 family)
MADGGDGEVREAPPSWWRLLVLTLFALAVAVLYLSGASDKVWDWFVRHRDEMRWFAQEHFAAAVAVFVVVCVLVIAGSFPFSWMFSVASGVLFGLAWGVVVMSSASAAGATLALLASRYLFRDWARSRAGRWLAVIDRGVERRGAYYLFLLRLTPLVPFFAINLALGLTRMPARTFWAVSQLGMLPCLTLYVYAGTQLGRIESPRDVLSWPLMLAFLGLGVLPLLPRLLLRNRSEGSAQP